MPLVNDDGTPLSGISGYRIHYGSSPSSLSSTINVSGGSVTRYTVSNLSAGTYYFSISTLSSSGSLSNASAVASITIQ
jgi:hypothetical protein